MLERPSTRPQNTADRQRLAPDSSSPPVEPIQLHFVPGDPVPGLSSWILEEQLGVGGFGEVWRARHEWKTSRRAVKFCTHPEARHRLVNHEKKVLVRVMRYAGDHPNIVPLLECNLESETPWLMYEYVPGGTLSEAVRDWQPLSPPKRVKKVIKSLYAISSAIGHCHRLSTPIVHRDLKPGNVLRDAGGVFRVTDFGIGGAAVAHFPEEQTHDFNSMTGRVPTMIRAAGSFGYSSPQQRNGAPPDPRDDVYALGVLAFQMLLGDLSLWPCPDMADDLRALGLPAGLVSLLVHSVAHNANRRPQDAGEWKDALGVLLKKRPDLSETSTHNLPALPADQSQA
ncbi:MAG: serine/threonine protein kinase [Planctomycetia bacterium]|nr:serine/threonine protein kinase [Planctomycetia bacterium]